MSVRQMMVIIKLNFNKMYMFICNVIENQPLNTSVVIAKIFESKKLIFAIAFGRKSSYIFAFSISFSKFQYLSTYISKKIYLRVVI